MITSPGATSRSIPWIASSVDPSYFHDSPFIFMIALDLDSTSELTSWVCGSPSCIVWDSASSCRLGVFIQIWKSLHARHICPYQLILRPITRLDLLLASTSPLSEPTSRSPQ